MLDKLSYNTIQDLLDYVDNRDFLILRSVCKYLYHIPDDMLIHKLRKESDNHVELFLNAQQSIKQSNFIKLVWDDPLECSFQPFVDSNDPHLVATCWKVFRFSKYTTRNLRQLIRCLIVNQKNVSRLALKIIFRSTLCKFNNNWYTAISMY